MEEQRANRRATRRSAAYQRPRRKPKFAEPEGVVQSEAKPSDSTEPKGEAEKPKKRAKKKVAKKKFEDPLKYGDVD